MDIIRGSVSQLVGFRAVATWQLRQFLWWWYVTGFVFGFVTGPLHLALYSFKSVRKSKGWEYVSDGACAGLAALTAGLYYRLRYGYKCRSVLAHVSLLFRFLVPVLYLYMCWENRRRPRCYGTISGMELLSVFFSNNWNFCSGNRFAKLAT